jgi:hypothetical protein
MKSPSARAFGLGSMAREFAYFPHQEFRGVKSGVSVLPQRMRPAKKWSSNNDPK